MNPADHAFFLGEIDRRIDALERRESVQEIGLACEVRQLRTRLSELTQRANMKLGGWDKVQLARHPGRPVLGDYLRMIVRDFCELYGDRCFGDDPALTTGLGRIAGHRVMIIGDPSWRGKGLAAKATAAIVDYGFETLGLNRIYLRTLGGNLKNIKLNERMGFCFEGVLKEAAIIDGQLADIVLMAMLRSRHSDPRRVAE